jgi:hypothetical protein
LEAFQNLAHACFLTNQQRKQFLRAHGNEVRSAWDDAKGEAHSVRSAIGALESAATTPIHLPSPAEVEERILDL